MRINAIPQECVIFSRPYSQRDGIDNLRRFGAEEGTTQYLACFRIDNCFQQAIRLLKGTCPRKCCRRNPCNTYLSSRTQGLFFSHTDTRQRRIDENGVRHSYTVIFRTASATEQQVFYHPIIVQRDVGKLKTTRHIAHCPDIWYADGRPQ